MIKKVPESNLNLSNDAYRLLRDFYYRKFPPLDDHVRELMAQLYDAGYINPSLERYEDDPHLMFPQYDDDHALTPKGLAYLESCERLERSRLHTDLRSWLAFFISAGALIVSIIALLQ